MHLWTAGVFVTLKVLGKVKLVSRINATPNNPDARPDTLLIDLELRCSINFKPAQENLWAGASAHLQISHKGEKRE